MITGFRKKEAKRAHKAKISNCCLVWEELIKISPSIHVKFAIYTCKFLKSDILYFCLWKMSKEGRSRMESFPKRGKHMWLWGIMNFICIWEGWWEDGLLGQCLRAWYIAIAWYIVTPCYVLVRSSEIKCFGPTSPEIKCFFTPNTNVLPEIKCFGPTATEILCDLPKTF